MNRTTMRRKVIQLFRIANTGLHNLVRNAWLTTAAIAVMTVTITIVISAVVANFALQETIEVQSRELTISIFLEDGSAQSPLEDQLKQEIESNEFVDSVYHKSKEEALSDFQDQIADNDTLLEGLALAEGNPVPASFEVFMSDLNEYQQILDIASSDEFSEIVNRTNDRKIARDAFNGFTSTQERINGASIVLGGIFGSISILIIFNTIRMAIFTRSDELEIMKLIGATPNYIRGPYLFEAMMYGFVAAIISISTVYTVALPYAKTFQSDQQVVSGGVQFDGIFPDGVVAYFTEQWYMVLILAIVGGMTLGLLSSSVAMAKYLRLKKW